jgi:hypothetical protein
MSTILPRRPLTTLLVVVGISGVGALPVVAPIAPAVAKHHHHKKHQYKCLPELGGERPDGAPGLTGDKKCDKGEQ